MARNKTDEFFELFNKLESLIEEIYSVPENVTTLPWLVTSNQGLRGMYCIPAGVDALTWLIGNNRGFLRYRDELMYCCDVRDFLLNNNYRGKDYAVDINDSMLECIKDTILRIKHMPRAEDLCTKEVHVAHMNDYMVDVFKDLKTNEYTNIPVVSNNTVIGVFNEKVLTTWLFKHESLVFGVEDTLMKFKDLLLLENQGLENFAFVSKCMLGTEIADMFCEYLHQQKHLGMVFVTEHGNMSEELIGVITEWDMAKFF